MSSTPGELIISTLCPQGVLLLELQRPPVNAFNETLWTLLASKLDQASGDPSVRAVVLASANDKYFSAGLDLHQTPSALTTPGSDPARRAFALKCEIQQFQHSISSLEQCCKPVICALNGVALGLAIDIASAADIRLASEDAVLAIAEIDIGLAADIGTLQRFPKKIGNESMARELALSGRRFTAAEALQIGFVSKVVAGSRQDLICTAMDLATKIAAKSPVAVAATKDILNFSANHSIEDGLRYTQAVNSAALQTEDIERSIKSVLEKQAATFRSLGVHQAKAKL